MAYKCFACNFDLVYSDIWVAGFNADGTRANKCNRCNQSLSKVDEIQRAKSAAINTKNCSGASKLYTH